MKTPKEMTEEEILAEYLKEYPKVERDNDCLFEFYSGKNGNRIKGKKRIDLSYYTDLNYLDTLFIDVEEENFWKNMNSEKDCTVYMWGSSLLIDFGDNFYYELNDVEDEQELNDYMLKNKKIFVAQYNSKLNKVEEVFETDIIIL